MFVSFDSLPHNSRTWVYQSYQKLNESEQGFLLEKAKKFINSWQSHGSDLKGSAKILNDHFLILAVDESFYSPSGCSIDKSVHFIQSLENECSLKLMDRTIQGYLVGDQVRFFPIGKAKDLIMKEELKLESKIFNINVSNKGELEANFLITADKSWLAKFFKKPQLTL